MKFRALWFGVFVMCLSFTAVSHAKDKTVHRGIYYGPENATEYQKEKCKLDIYLPGKKFKKFPVLIFFHGGGLTGGGRGGPRFTDKGVATVAPSYRLYPKVQCPGYLEDAAAAVAWTFKNIEKYGGDPKKIFISGMSAGSYLTAMLGMDKSWLEKHGVDVDKIAGLIPVSGHMITHFTVRKGMGIKAQCGLSDKYSPLFHVRKTPFPILMQCGDNDYPSRQQENRLFESMMIRYARQPRSMITYLEYPGTHGSFFGAVPRKDLLQFILEKSGMAKPSGLFEGSIKQKDMTELAARNYGGKAYVDMSGNTSAAAAFDITLPGSGKKFTMDGSEFAVIDGEVKTAGKAEVRVMKKVPLKVIDTPREYSLGSGAAKSLTLGMKGGSQVKVWTENKMFNIELTAKDKAVLASHDKGLWNGDAMEVFIDRSPFSGLGQDGYPVTGKKVEVHQYIFAAKPAPTGKKIVLLKNHRGSDTKAESKIEITAEGYTLRAMIPLDEISPLGKPDKVIGFSFQRCVKDTKDQSGAYKEYFMSEKPSHTMRFHYPLFKVADF